MKERNQSIKTTLISMLTGLCPPNEGNGWISGFDIKENIDQVHLRIGVCPQFDLLWPELTVEEHLLFYARIKGVPKSEEEKYVEKAMRDVHLESFASFPSSQLSGRV